MIFHYHVSFQGSRSNPYIIFMGLFFPNDDEKITPLRLMKCFGDLFRTQMNVVTPSHCADEETVLWHVESLHGKNPKKNQPQFGTSEMTTVHVPHIFLNNFLNSHHFPPLRPDTSRMRWKTWINPEMPPVRDFSRRFFLLPKYSSKNYRLKKKTSELFNPNFSEVFKKQKKQKNTEKIPTEKKPEVNSLGKKICRNKNPRKKNPKRFSINISSVLWIH